MTTKITTKLSPLVPNQLPDFVQSDHQLFSNFVQDFYKFLESAKITYSATTNYLVQEPETKAYVLSENGILGAAVDRLVLEDSIEFLDGETIVGQTSGAKSTVIVEDVRNTSLYITSNMRFEINEVVKGSTSGAEAKLLTYKGNPVQNIQQLLEYADVDNTLNEYFDQFREAFLKVIPNSLASEVSKRDLIKSIKDLYSAKGTSEGHKLFMRLLLNENANVIYPNENMMRVSGGQWKQKIKVRCLSLGLGSSSEILNQIITGKTSGATATVDAAATFQQGINSVSELELENISGTFITGETIEALSTATDTIITFQLKSVVTGTSLSNAGLLHSLSEAGVIDSDKGNGFADVLINTVKEGSISDVHIQAVGSGYEVGDKVLFSGGSGITSAEGIISAVGGSFLLEDGTGNITREVGTVTSMVPFTIAIEKREVGDGPYYVNATAEYKQLGAGLTGYFYPLYLTQAAAGGVDASHAHSFLDFPGITFYMPATELNHGKTDLPTSHNYTSWPIPPEDNILLERTDSTNANSGDKIETNERQESLDSYGNDNDILILEEGTFATLEEASSINRIFLNNLGTGYTSLPSISIETDDGTGGSLLSLTNNIGAIESLKVNDSGFLYDADDIPDMEFQAHFVLKDVTGNFLAGNTLTTHTGVVKGYNASTQQLDVTIDSHIHPLMEQAADIPLSFILEDQDSTLNESNLLMEDTQLVDMLSTDNIALNGTSVTQAPIRFVQTDVRVKTDDAGLTYYYVIDSVKQRNLILQQGWTYKFDLSDSSLYNEISTRNHPFLFSTTPDGTHGLGVEYTTGVTKSPITIQTGTEGAFIQITVAANAGTLYYYNSNYADAGGKITTQVPKDIINDIGDEIIMNGSGVNKFKMLIETPFGENPLLGIAYEDNSGTVTLESSNISVIQDENNKIVLDGLIDIGTAFVLNESSGEAIKTQDHGNKLLTEDGGEILSESDDDVAIGGDNIVLDGTDSSANNAGSDLIMEQGIDFSGNDVVITDSSGASGTIILSDIATGAINVGVTQITEGAYSTISSLIDEDLIRIQDSYYYQQFSYEVQVGQSTASYLNELKRAVHPAGFAPFGKVSIATFLSAAIGTAGSSLQDQPDSVATFSPILASTLQLVFDETIRRRHYVPRVTARIGTRDQALVMDGTNGSSADAGDNLLFEAGTYTNIGGLGGFIMTEDSHRPGNQELVFVPQYKISVQSKARAR